MKLLRGLSHLSCAPVLLLAFTLCALHAQDTRAVGSRTPSAPATGSPGGYYALVIGIDDYTVPPPPQKGLVHLKTAVHDAQEVAQVLKDNYGFHVTLLLDGKATRGAILDTISAYQQTLREADNLLIYYAGHGYSTRNTVTGAIDKTYWLPVDATSGSSSNRIIADDLTSDIGQMSARHVLIVSDSCYAGGLSRDASASTITANDPAFFPKMLAGRSRTLMASGGDEPVSDNGPDNHSIFAAALLQALRSADGSMFTANTIFADKILPLVAGNSNQVPEYGFIRSSGHVAGDFVFVRSSGRTASSSTLAASSAPAAPVAAGTTRGTVAVADRQALFDRGIAFSQARNYAEALPLFSSACSAGLATACSDLGLLYEHGHGVGQNVPQAAGFYRKACDGGDMAGCGYLGVMYSNGTGVVRDDAQGVALLRRSCDGGDGYGCSNLGLVYEHGTGVAKDFVQSVSLYRKACDRGNAEGCGYLGVMYTNGAGVARDDAQSLKLLRKACEGGSAVGCANLGLMYEHGNGIARDAAQAVSLYRKACDGGSTFGCTNLKRVQP